MSSSGQGSSGGVGRGLKRADPKTIQDKFLVGYQGWFTCAGDGEPVEPAHHGWLHWFNSPIPHGGHPNIDLWPDVSSYSQAELFPAPGLKYPNGSQVHLFSSRNPKTVQRHFHWMAEHGIDGAFLQRFATQCDIEVGNEGILRIRNEVDDRVREAAEAEGRVFAIMYDVSNVPADRIQIILERDWAHLIHTKRILDSPAYLREKGKPVVALWGFGFENAGHTPELVRAIINYIRQITPGGAYVMGGAPAHWRTAECDADRNPGFLDVWLNEFDAISPWTVGRYRNERDADVFAENQMRGDSALIKRRNEEGTWRKIDYIPVVLPGASALNRSEGRWAFNGIPRQGGRFLWKQIANAKRFGARIIYGAMWDGYDEGTSLMPAIEKKRLLPVSEQFQFLALDQDGYDVPSDWYMRICGFAAEGLRSERRIHETFPSKELQDYWATRPRYEEVPEAAVSQGATGTPATGSGQASYEDWLNAQKGEKDEAPPPPYTLEAEEDSPATQPEEGPPTNTATATNNVHPPVQASPRLSASATTAIPSLVAVGAAAALYSAPPTQPVQVSQVPSGPPPVNVNSRPSLPGSPTSPNFVPAPVPNVQAYPQSISPYPSQAPYPPTQLQDPVTALANDFGRQSINNVAPQATHTPPPVHPARPGGRPSVAQGRPDHPTQVHHGSFSRPQSQSPPGSQAATPLSSQTPSQSPVWPPPEWGTGRPQQQSVPPQRPSTSGHGACDNFARPHTITVSPYSSTSSYRPLTVPPPQPHVSSSPGQGAHMNLTTPPLPHTPSSPLQASMFLSGPSTISPAGFRFPVAGPSAGYQPDYISYNPQGGPSYPSASAYNPSQGHSNAPVTLPSAHTATNPSAFSTAGPGYGDCSSTTQTFPAAQSTYPQSDYSSGYTQQHGASTYGMPYASSAPGSSHSGGVYFPQVQAPQSQSMGLPQALTPGSGYFNQQGSGSGYDSSQQTSSSAWVPGAAINPNSPLPPRPMNYSQYQGSSSFSSVGPSVPPAVPPGAIGMALNAVDKFAGKKTRQQIESSVGSLAQTGSKLFGKLTK